MFAHHIRFDRGRWILTQDIFLGKATFIHSYFAMPCLFQPREEARMLSGWERLISSWMACFPLDDPRWIPGGCSQRSASSQQPCCCAVGSLCCWEALAVPLIIVTPVAQLSLTPSMPSVRWECCWFNVGLVNLSGELPMAAHSKHAIFRHSVLCVSLKYQQYSLMTLSHTACSTNTSGCINERNSVMPVWPPWV